MSRTINCDQVAWMMDVFARYLPPDNYPAVSRYRSMLMYTMLYEIMEVADLTFEDELARHNGTPTDCRSENGQSQYNCAQGASNSVKQT